MSKHNYNKRFSYVDLDYQDRDSRDYISLFRGKLDSIFNDEYIDTYKRWSSLRKEWVNY
jgi:hypothetical protein